MTSSEAPVSTRFDVRAFARTAQGNHRAELRLGSYAGTPLSADSLRMVRYLARLESATMEQLRNLLVTATHKDARVTAFLVTWAFEKFWIADALDAVLEANGQPASHEVEEGASKRRRAESGDRRGPIRRAVSAMFKGFPIVAVHVTSGLVDEWVMRDAYERLIDKAGSDDLTSTLRMILSIRQRHEEFFDGEAQRRLAESERSAQLTRKAFASMAWPIGAVDRDAADRTFFDGYVFGAAEGKTAAEQIGRRVAALPGMDDALGRTVAARLAA